MAADPIPLPLIGTAHQSSQLGGFGAGFALDNVVNFTHTQANADLPGPAVWQVKLNDTYQFETVTIWNRSASDGAINCCPQRLRDIEIEIVEGFSGNPAIDFSTAGGGSVTYVSALLNPENGLPGATVNPVNLTVDIVAATGGTKSGNLLRIKRFPDLDRSGNPGGNADDPTVLSLDLVEATGSRGLTVVHSSPAHGEVVASSPAFATIDFSAPVFVASLDAGDLTVDGADSLDFDVVDVDTVRFDLPPLAAGEHTLAIAAGVIEAQQAGLPAIVAFSATFTIPASASVANLPASDVSAFAAQIGAEVTDTGGDDPDVLLYWGDDDAGTNPAAWDNVIPVGSGGVGSYTAGINDLTHNTPYFYRAFATNLSGDVWAAATATFTTLLLGLPAIATDPVTSVGGFAADVSGTVTDTGGDVPDVTVYYGTTDGATDKNAWDFSIVIGERVDTFSTTLDGLDPQTTYMFRALAANAAGESWSPLTREFTTTSAPRLQISELMAKNDTTLTTRTRDSEGEPFTGSQQTPDWIEIENLTGEEVNIGGAHLTDNVGNPTKWQFPGGTTIPAGGFLVVFASGDDMTDPVLDERGYLHTGFNLDGDGEYLALTAGDGTLIHEYAPRFPDQVSDISYGIQGGLPRYFATPTPGTANSTDFTDVVLDTIFSVDRGFYDAPFDVEITTPTAEATIRYTLDGSPPSETFGQIYDGPIHVGGTTTLRAMAFKPGFQSTNIDTQTYLFVTDIIQQTFQSTRDAGFPSSWGGNAPDYGLDSRIVGPGDQFGGQYAGQNFFDALKAVPTLSLVTDINGVFGSNGIYSRAGDHNLEVPTSFELINPDGSKGFQINAGLKIQGGAFRSFGLTDKNSFRLKFKSQYGPAKLKFPFFGDDAADEFDTITLRMEANDGWQWTADPNRLYARDEWGRRTQLAMGQPGSHGARMHVYINCIYWGLYNPVERPDHSFASTYIGGEKEEWDNQNSGRAINGDLVSWNTMLSLARDVANQPAGSVAQRTAWQRLQGNDPNGANDLALEDFLDVDNLIDYMIVNLYGGNSDWPNKNFYAGRQRGPDSTGFKFFMWDSEWSLNLQSNVNTNRTGVSSGIALPYAILKNVPEFRIRFADRLHGHFFNGGALYVDPDNTAWDPAHPERNVPAARFVEVTDEVGPALLGESARWGDQHQALQTVDEDWRPQVVSMLANYFPRRSANVLQQFRGATLYPGVGAPEFLIGGTRQHGGVVSSGAILNVENPNGGAGTIWMTSDGSDPRLSGGAVNAASAVPFTGQFSLTTIGMFKARILSGGQWSALSKATFFVDPPTAANFAITEINYHPHDVTAAERVALGLTPGEPHDADDFEFVEFQNISGQTIQLGGGSFAAGIDFDFNSGSGGVTTLDPGQFVLLVKNQTAFEARYGSGLNIAGEFAGSSLDNNGETITLHDAVGGTIHDFTYNDDGAWPGRADGTGSSLLVIDVAGDYDDADNWRASVELGGSPGEQGLGAFHDVVINEILTHTDLPQRDAIELFNTTDDDVDVSGWYISDTNDDFKKFRIPGTPGGLDATIIAAGGYLVFDEEDFNPSGGLDPLNNPNDFAFSSAEGDDAWLLAADDGRLVRFADHAEFGAAANGVSFGLVIDSTGRGSYAAMQQLTIGGPNSPPRVGPVVIHEIMYNPGERGGSEFIELLNISEEAVSLAGWNFDGIDFTFGDGAVIEPGGLVVVVPDPIAFLIVHDELNEDVVFGPYDGALNNAGESLRLNRPDEPQIDGFIPSITVDQIRYDDKAPWPVEADGTGVALQRITPDEYGNDPINWGVTLSGGTPGNFFILPTVLEVLVSGSDWSPAMLARIAADGLGQDGFSIPAGSEQLRSLAWTGIDRITLRFSEHVEVTSDDLRVAGVNVSDYGVIDFQYDRPSQTATWTLQRPIEADNLLVAVSANVRDGSDFPLDGNWTDATSMFPSGNGAIDSGDAFQFRLNVLLGDVTSAGGVSRGDLLAVIGALGTSAEQPQYDVRLDVDGDGSIRVDDLRQLLLRQGSRLPSAEPQASVGPLPRIAVDAVFERMGQAASQAATTPSAPARRETSSSSMAIKPDRPLHRHQATGRTIANDATDITADRNAIFVRRSRRSQL